MKKEVIIMPVELLQKCRCENQDLKMQTQLRASLFYLPYS